MTKKKAKKDKPPKKKDTIASYAFAIGIALAIRWCFAEAYVIPSGSMLPTLLLHDHIFVNKLVYGIRTPFTKTWITKFKKPEKGEIIVFKHPKDESTFLIKRIVATPGDKIYYDGHDLYINDQLVPTTTAGNDSNFDKVPDEDLENEKSEHEALTEQLNHHDHIVLNRKGEPSRMIGPLTVPADSLFVMGDHRDNSADSRFWGFVPEENILGRAMFVWLSCGETLPVIHLLCDPTTIRWTRFGHVIK